MPVISVILDAVSIQLRQRAAKSINIPPCFRAKTTLIPGMLYPFCERMKTKLIYTFIKEKGCRGSSKEGVAPSQTIFARDPNDFYSFRSKTKRIIGLDTTLGRLMIK